MNSESTLTWRGFGLRWVAASALGWAIGMGLAEWLDNRASLFVVGLVLGTMHWLVLSARLRRSAWWIPATVVAWSVGLRIGLELGFFTPDPYSTGSVGGVLAGVLQYAILRGQASRPVLWIPASLVGSILAWVAGTIVGGNVYDSVQNDAELLGYIAGGAAGGLVFGIVTAPVLLRMLKPTRIEQFSSVRSGRSKQEPLAPMSERHDEALERSFKA